MHKTFLFTLVSVFVIFAIGGNVDKKLDNMQMVQQEQVKGFFIKHQLKHPDSLFKKKEIIGVTVAPKLEGLKLSPPTSIASEYLVSLPELPSINMFVSYKNYYKEKSEFEAKIIRLEMNMEQLIGITESIQTSTVDNRAFLLKIIEILVGALVGGGGIWGGIVTLRRKKG